MSASEEQEFSAEIAASGDHCFAAITTFEKYPEWFSPIERATVLARYRDGLAKRVEYYINMRIKTIRYVLEYRYDKPTHLTWKAVDGDLESIVGSYVFEKLGPRRTRATCRQAVSIGFWVPGPLRALMERQALKQSVLEFKAGAEASAKQAGTPRRRQSQG
jgi:polyketide cyclase/dehydrase/lipid transport protein